MKIALICYKKQEKYSTGAPDEDQDLLKFLLDKGLNIDYVIWNDPLVDWTKYGTAVLKSPWDYHEQFEAFNAWLDKLEALKIKLLNPYSIIRQNSDKHYLDEITASGLKVIPSLFLERNSKAVLNDFFKTFNTPTLIIKPCVSASAKNTMVVNPDNVSERQAQLNAFLNEESFMVQPFVNEIVQGELSFIFFGGIYSHAVIKLPKAGDFRVQHFHGGTIRKYEPGAQQIAEAQKYVDGFAAGCLYARVDGLLIEGSFQLMELELIEPYLFLNTHDGAYESYYNAMLRLMQ
ncbi:MAG: hypothetical protein V4635_04875 [Bacteroidota bacterium]